MTIQPRSLSGLQCTRVYNSLARFQTGGAATLGILSSGPRVGEATAFIPLLKRSNVLLSQSIIDRDTNIALEIEDTDLRGSRLLGGVLNGLNDDGTLEDGIYYSFLASFDESPDDRGYLNPEDTFFYLSNHFISFGVGSDPVRGGRGRFNKPINPRTNRPMQNIRPMRGVFQVQNNRFIPWLMLGEGNTVEAYYQFSEWRNYKSCTVDGVKYDERGRKFFDFEASRDPAEFETLVAPDSSEWLGFWHKIPQNHKAMKLRVTFEGEGKVYCSVSGSKGELVAVGNGGQGTSSFMAMSGSDAGGRGVKITTEGNITVTQLYILSTTSQQPS